MTYVYWFIIAGLIWNCVYFSRACRKQAETIQATQISGCEYISEERDSALADYPGSEGERLSKKATPEDQGDDPKALYWSATQSLE